MQDVHTLDSNNIGSVDSTMVARMMTDGTGDRWRVSEDGSGLVEALNLKPESESLHIGAWEFRAAGEKLCLYKEGKLICTWG